MLVATVGEGTKGRGDEGTKGQRDAGKRGRRDAGTEGQRDREAGRSHVVDEVVLGLRAKLEDHRRSQARRAGWARQVVPMGLVRIDARLPGGGLPCGAITEILSDEPGAGSMTLAMRVGRKKGRRDVGTEGRRDKGTEEQQRDQEIEGSRDRKIVVVDVCGDFYPPAAARHGVALDRIIVIRTTNEQDAFWAVDQSLRCPGVAVVIATLRHLDGRLSRRLQLAAESSGAIGLVLRPAHPRIKSFAAVQMLVEGVGRRRDEGTKGRRDTGTERQGIEGLRDQEIKGSYSSVAPDPKPVASGPRGGRFEDAVSGTHLDVVDEVHLCRITLLKVREGMPAEPLLVDLHHEAGALPVHALPVERSSAKRA